MTRLLLDTGVLGMVTNPTNNATARDCKAWLQGRLASGAAVHVPEIADYELRRELVRAKLEKAIRRLETLEKETAYLPITTAAMNKAAELWAQARNTGHPTAPDPALDGDMILAAQALLSGEPGDQVIVATTNVAHLALFVQAKEWQDIV
jgi:predicted nucleic acid-binding protein